MVTQIIKVSINCPRICYSGHTDYNGIDYTVREYTMVVTQNDYNGKEKTAWCEKEGMKEGMKQKEDERSALYTLREGVSTVSIFRLQLEMPQTGQIGRISRGKRDRTRTRKMESSEKYLNQEPDQ
jgi:hypothetical protein